MQAETARELSRYTDPETGIRMDAPKQLLLRMRSVPAYEVRRD